MPGNLPTCTCGDCRKCRHRVASRKWRERNQQLVREKDRRYREENPERVASAQRRYRDSGRAAENSLRWRESNPERAKEVKASFYERHAERLRKERREYRQREPDKERARWTLNNAIRRGDVVRGRCEVGGDCLGRIEAHHDDYSRPLDVRWFCQRHHSRTHAT